MPLAYPSNRLVFPTTPVGPMWAPQITQGNTISSPNPLGPDPMKLGHPFLPNSLGPDPMKLGRPLILKDHQIVATHSNKHNQHIYAQSENKSLIMILRECGLLI